MRGIKFWALGLVLVLALAACGGGESADPAEPAEPAGNSENSETTAATGEFDWQQFEGEQIRVVLNQHPWQQAIEPKIDEFEELTGIEVEVESLPEQQFRQRVQVEMTGGSSDLDVFMTSVQNEGAKFAANDWYEGLRPYAENASLTGEEYEFSDLSESVLEGHTFDSTLAGIPIQLETQMLFYRKDILDEAGVEVPTTFEELEQVAAEIDDPSGTRAFVARGAGASAVTQIATFLFNHGANWTEDGSSEPAFNTPEGVEAFDYYTSLIREYGPDGATNMSWEEALPLFQQGQVAMYTDASTFLPQVQDESIEEVSNNVGFAKMPSGPGGDFQTFNGWALAMSPFSDNKEAAWYFIQWATSPDMVETLTQEGGIAGARQSVDFGDAYPEDWVNAFTESLPKARPQLPQVIPVPEVRDAIGTAVVAGIQGDDVEPAVEQSAQQFSQIVESAGGGQ
jgi:multiple sugar transport system substrate-binding protein